VPQLAPSGSGVWLQAPVATSQLSAVQGLLSPQLTGVPAWHLPATHCSVPLQALPSEQSAFVWQATPTQTPAWQVPAPFWQAVPSATGVWAQAPVGSVQLSAVQSLPSLQLTFVPEVHTPPTHCSMPLQARPSEHSELVTQPMDWQRPEMQPCPVGQSALVVHWAGPHMPPVQIWPAAQSVSTVQVPGSGRQRPSGPHTCPGPQLASVVQRGAGVQKPSWQMRPVGQSASTVHCRGRVLGTQIPARQLRPVGQSALVVQPPGRTHWPFWHTMPPGSRWQSALVAGWHWPSTHSMLGPQSAPVRHWGPGTQAPLVHTSPLGHWASRVQETLGVVHTPYWQTWPPLQSALVAQVAGTH
jgi:hypothetical protein